MDIKNFDENGRKAIVQNILEKKFNRLLEEYENSEMDTLNEDVILTSLVAAAIGGVVSGLVNAAAKFGVSKVTLKSIKKKADPYYLKGLRNYNLSPDDEEKITVQDVMSLLAKDSTNEDQRIAIRACKILKKSAEINGHKVIKVLDQEKFDEAAKDLFQLYTIYSEDKKKPAKKAKPVEELTESRLPKDGRDPEFGVPEQKKYPLFDEAHVRSAIKLFGHVDPRYERELALAILAKMRKYGLSVDLIGEENKLHKYIPQTMLDAAEKSQEKIHEDIVIYKNDLFQITTESNNIHMNRCADILGHIFNESIIDPVHDQLCQDLFDGEELRKDVLDYVKKALEDWTKSMNFKGKILAVTCSGSLLTYQYNPTTDLDVHVYLDGSNEELSRLRKAVPAALFIPNTNHPIEYTIMMGDHGNNDQNAENLYDLLNDKWLKRTEKSEMGTAQIPTDYITRISKFYMMAIDAAVGQADVHKRELLNLEERPVELHFSEEDKVKAIKEKINGLIEDRDGLYFIVKLLRSFRTVAYDNHAKANKIDDLLGANFEIKLPNDPHYSLNEMIFKTIERYGYKTKVDKYVRELDDLISKYEEKMKADPVKDGKETIER